MNMIIGGAFQGKEIYARKQYPNLVWIDGETAAIEELRTAQGILNFHRFIRRELEAGRSVSALAEELIAANPQVILTCDEVGCGVVPMDALDREYRESVGRVCTELAAYSTQVTRVICGIGTVIKND